MDKVKITMQDSKDCFTEHSIELNQAFIVQAARIAPSEGKVVFITGLKGRPLGQSLSESGLSIISFLIHG